MSDRINRHCCSAYCFGAYQWTGITTQNMCSCLHKIKHLETEQQIKSLIEAYQEELNKHKKIIENLVESPEIAEQLYTESN